MHRRRAFTLVELLVVIAILGILLAFLLPVISRARAAAMKTVCSARLHDLSLASLQYLGDNKRLPAPARDNSLPPPAPGLPHPAVPHHLSVTLINAFQPYFKHNPIPSDLPLNQLSPVFQCPFVEGLSDDRGPFLPNSPDTYYYTGYSYLARLDEGAAVIPNPTASLLPQLPLGLNLNLSGLGVNLNLNLFPTLLKTNRSANARATRRAPVWADDLRYNLTPSPSWTYWHRRSGAPAGAAPLSVTHTKPLLGQHVAYSDGSVQWVPAQDLNLDVSSQPLIDLHASFKLPGTFVWWF